MKLDKPVQTPLGVLFDAINVGQTTDSFATPKNVTRATDLTNRVRTLERQVPGIYLRFPVEITLLLKVLPSFGVNRALIKYCHQVEDGHETREFGS